MRLYGLIGYPLSHSFSRKYFIEKFRKENITNAEYKLFPLGKISGLPQLLFNNTDLYGLNVTIPYKEAVIPFLDELDETAKAVGAVNTIKIIHNNKSRLIGYNTDIYGFRQSIKPFLEANHERALILGTGGASKAVEYVLTQIGVNCLFVSRNPKKKNEIAYQDINEYVIKSHLLIVNTTPIGMYPGVDNSPSIPYEFLTEKHFLYDLVYNPEETIFLKLGRIQGAQGINGLSMLHLQAEKACEIWNGS